MAALKRLTKAIGVYGDRERNPIYICWGNGLAMRDKEGWLMTSGTPSVALEIKKIERLSQRSKKG